MAPLISDIDEYRQLRSTFKKKEEKKRTAGSPAHVGLGAP